MKTSWLMRISALAAFAAVSPGAFALVIDDFNNGGVSISANAANPLVQTVTTGAGIIGGEREATAVYYAPGSSALDDVRLRVDFLNQNSFSHSQDAGVAGMSILV